MVQTPYDWAGGADLKDHSKIKHKILREYFFQYLTIRCQIPQQSQFRLAVIDGFAGGGLYQGGVPGSPLIFIEELKRAVEAVNLHRSVQGLGGVDIQCLLILNELDREVLELLKSNVAPAFAELQANHKKLHLRVEYLNEPFERAYPKIKAFLQDGQFRNVLFNLDQCGHSHVEYRILLDIMRNYPSAEIFYTFAIEALISFLRQSNPVALSAQLRPMGVTSADLRELDGIANKNQWLGTAERLVFESFKTCAPYVSPFSINNPDGWRYWLIHFANKVKARQVYNDILHSNSSTQAHFGRSGLKMLSHDPSHGSSSLYLFGDHDRAIAREQLLEDIPRVVAESGDVISVSDFYEAIYNETPAHAQDIHQAIIDNPDIEVITPGGGERRKASTISVDDVLKLKDQKSFFSLFNNKSK